MRPKWLVFWGEQPEKIQPFGGWDVIRPGPSLLWWQAYQDVKHNRIINRYKATLENAVNALAGLFLAILRCENCRDGIRQAGWIKNPGDNVSDIYTDLFPYFSDANDSFHSEYSHQPFYPRMAVIAETQLFSYPPGWWAIRKDKHPWLNMNASHRFRKWFGQNQWEAPPKLEG
jgi:hypothetical protein